MKIVISATSQIFYGMRILFTVLFFASLSFGELLDIDKRGTLPNDNSKPLHVEPIYKLAPTDELGLIRRVKTDKKVVALTFDMCELATKTTGYDALIVEYLKLKNIPATFFMGGKWMRTHEKRVLEVMGEPLFEIANHAWSHGNFAIMSKDMMREQVEWTQAQYEILRQKALSQNPSLIISPLPTLFRFPYGRSSDEAFGVLSQSGLRAIQWDIVAEGVDERKTIKDVKNGSILLFHANLVPKDSAKTLKIIVEGLEEKGYSFATVSKLLELGEPKHSRDGYFVYSGDNLSLDTKFGAYGTGE